LKKYCYNRLFKLLKTKSNDNDTTENDTSENDVMPTNELDLIKEIKKDLNGLHEKLDLLGKKNIEKFSHDIIKYTYNMLKSKNMLKYFPNTFNKTNDWLNKRPDNFTKFIR
jgi:hypothetical protein